MKKASEFRLKHILSFIFIGISLVTMVVSLFLVQTSSSFSKQAKENETILNSIAETLNNNSKESEEIYLRFNQMNQESLSNLSMISENGVFNSIMELMKKFLASGRTDVESLSAAIKEYTTFTQIANSKYMYVINTKGQVVMSSNPNDIYQPITSKINVSLNDSRLFNGTETKDANGKTKIDPIVITEKDGSIEYVYTTKITGSDRLDENDDGIRYLLYGCSKEKLNDRLAPLSDVSKIMESIIVGDTGFAFCIDKMTLDLVHFEYKGVDYKGDSISDHGIDGKCLEDGFSGQIKIKGSFYYASTKEYTSPEHPGGIYIISAITVNELIRKNQSKVFFISLVLIAMTLVIWLYGYFLINHYVRTKNSPKTVLIYPFKKKNGEKKDSKFKVYFNLSVGRRTVMLGSVALVLSFFASSWTQSISSINDNINNAATSLNEVSKMVEENESIYQQVNEYYLKQYEDKSHQLAQLIETNPYGFLNFDVTKENIFEYKDDANKGTLSISQSGFLQAVCKGNSIDCLRVYDNLGRTIATSDSEWDYVLPNNSSDVRSKMRRILEGKDEKINFEVSSEDDNSSGTCRYFGYSFHYYTNSTGEFFSKAEYEKDSKNIRKYLGVIELYLDNTHVSSLTKTASLSYVIEQLVPIKDSQFMIYSSDADHTILFSDTAIPQGRKASEVGISDSVFLSNYNGFRTIDGVEYFEVIRFFNGYYCAIYTPTTVIYESNLNVSLIAGLISFVTAIILSLTLTLHSAKEEQAYHFVKFDEGYKVENDTVLVTLPNGRQKRVKGITADFAVTKKSWKNYTPEQKIGSVVKWTVFVIAIMVMLYVWLNTKVEFTTSPLIRYTLSGNWSHSVNLFSIFATGLLAIGTIIAFILCDIISRTINANANTHTETIVKLIFSILKYGGLIVVSFIALYHFGIDSTSLLASAGILSVVVGLGAQSLIGDILAGFFIAIEGSVGVGDIVTIGDYTGQIIDINLRTCKVKDRMNNVKIFNNSTLSSIINRTKNMSYAVCKIGIEYDEDIKKVEQILYKEFPRIRQRLPMIIDGPNFAGITEFDSSSVNILITAGCTEQNRIMLERALNKEIFIVFQQNNINVPFPQVTLSDRKDTRILTAGEEAETTEEEEKKE